MSCTFAPKSFDLWMSKASYSYDTLVVVINFGGLIGNHNISQLIYLKLQNLHGTRLLFEF
jgi:hypothetical protein